mgnify:CR=1 FL=1
MDELYEKALNTLDEMKTNARREDASEYRMLLEAYLLVEEAQLWRNEKD